MFVRCWFDFPTAKMAVVARGVVIIVVAAVKSAHCLQGAVLKHFTWIIWFQLTTL